MAKSIKTALWLAIPLLLVTSCSPGGAWGTTHSTRKWSTGLADDTVKKLPGMTSGAISKVVLEMGDKGVFHLAIWSSVDHDCSSGGGASVGAYVEGKVVRASGGQYPISLSGDDGAHLTGTIGDRELALEGSALLLIHEDSKGLVVEEVEVPGRSIQAFDLGSEVSRDTFAARWKVGEFFRNPRNR